MLFCDECYAAVGYATYVFLTSPDGKMIQFQGHPEKNFCSVTPFEVEQKVDNKAFPVFQVKLDKGVNIKHITFNGKSWKGGNEPILSKLVGIIPLGKVVSPAHREIVSQFISVG